MQKILRRPFSSQDFFAGDDPLKEGQIRGALVGKFCMKHLICGSVPFKRTNPHSRPSKHGQIPHNRKRETANEGK